MARCLNCEQGPTPEPCGTCAACVEIRAGSALDVVEIDGATYRKIDDARAIIENLSYRPARDRFKIYIIDEAHQLTDQAFNALLKTLEEPPAHVKFILATTEPQKMPETILSRLQRYDFRRIPFAVIFDRLKELASREGAAADEAALRMLAREAGGSMRDAERMLETAIASLDGKVVESEVASILGVASRSRVFGIVEAILGKNAAEALRNRPRTASRRREPRIARARYPRTAAQSRGCEVARRERPAKPARRSPRSGSGRVDAAGRGREQPRS